MAGRFNRLVRKINKYVTNPLLMRWAGRGSFYAGVIHHVGRKSGREYATPVYPQSVDGGFVIPLPYGEDTDWCRNVLAAGKATLDLRGESVQLVGPRIVRLPPHGYAISTFRPVPASTKATPSNFDVNM